MAAAMALAVALVGVVAVLLIRGAQDRSDRVTNQWIDSHLRDRQDDA
jgi:hypothetical protein